MCPPDALPVRQPSALPAASFRSHLAMDTLAVRLAVPLTGPAEDFPFLGHFLGVRPAGRTKAKRHPQWVPEGAGLCDSGRLFLTYTNHWPID